MLEEFHWVPHTKSRIMPARKWQACLPYPGLSPNRLKKDTCPRSPRHKPCPEVFGLKTGTWAVSKEPGAQPVLSFFPEPQLIVARLSGDLPLARQREDKAENPQFLKGPFTVSTSVRAGRRGHTGHTFSSSELAVLIGMSKAAARAWPLKEAALQSTATDQDSVTA